MAIVSDKPCGYGGALGVITLEDVIEGLIGEVCVFSSRKSNINSSFYINQGNC